MCENPRAKLNFYILYDGSKASIDEYDEKISGSNARFKGDDSFTYMSHFKHNEKKIQLKKKHHVSMVLEKHQSMEALREQRLTSAASFTNSRHSRSFYRGGPAAMKVKMKQLRKEKQRAKSVSGIHNYGSRKVKTRPVSSKPSRPMSTLVSRPQSRNHSQMHMDIKEYMP